MLGMISIFLNLGRLCLWTNMWSIFENVPCALEKNVYSASLGWNVLKMSIKSIWSSESFRIAVSLLIFCLEDLSRDVSGVLKSPTMIVLLSISPLLSSRSFFFMYLGAPTLVAYILSGLYLLVVSIPLVLWSSLLYLFWWTLLWSLFCLISVLLPQLYFISICLKDIFPSLHFQSVWVPTSEVGLL